MSDETKAGRGTGREGAPPLEIRHEEGGARGAFVHEREGARLAEMTYARVAPGRVVVDHTEVSPKLQGLGVGRRLLEALVAWARATGTRVEATCPYAKAQLEKDPSLRDVLGG